MIKDLIKDTSVKLLLEPNNVELIRLRALLYGSIDLYDLALEDLNSLLNMAPDDQEAYYLRSDCYLNKDEFDLAKHDFLRAIKISQKDDGEFVSGFSEEYILEEKMKDGDDHAELKKILLHEKTNALLRFFPLESKA